MPPGEKSVWIPAPSAGPVWELKCDMGRLGEDKDYVYEDAYLSPVNVCVVYSFLASMKYYYIWVYTSVSANALT